MAPELITVVGTGSWGTTLAIMLARAGRAVTLLARTPDEADTLNRDRMNARYVPDVLFPTTLHVVGDPALAIPQAGIVLLAVPSQTMRANVAALQPLLAPRTALLSCAKGFEHDTLLRMSSVIAAELPAEHHGQIGVLTGPNIAHEVALGQPATSVVATNDPAAARLAQRALSTPLFRVYSSDDVAGAEIAGSLKNIIALGAGISDGMRAGDNAKAAFITRGLAEIARLGLALGANPLTFAGLAGLGDLVATCASPHSRNRRLGEALAQGLSLEEAKLQLGQVAEGVTTVQTARALAAQHSVEMPITEQLYAVLFEHKNPRGAIVELMQREVKHELG